MRRITIAIIMALALITSGCGGQWMLYYDSQIPGKVVDAETGNALEGAVVIGLWAYTDMFGGGHGGFANIEVVESNKDGDFRIPAWIWFNPLKFIYFIEDSDPMIVIYKPGYGVHRSSKVWRSLVTMPTNLTDAEKAQALIDNSITPARLNKLLSDKQKIENIDELRSITFLSDWPIISFKKKKLYKAIIDEINTLNIQSSDKHKMLNHYR